MLKASALDGAHHAFVLVRAFRLLERWLRVDACQGR